MALTKDHPTDRRPVITRMIRTGTKGAPQVLIITCRDEQCRWRGETLYSLWIGWCVGGDGVCKFIRTNETHIPTTLAAGGA